MSLSTECAAVLLSFRYPSIQQNLSAILRNGTRYITSFFSCCHTNRQSTSYVTCLIRHLTSTTTQVIGWWVQTTSAGSQSATWLMTSILSRGKWSLVPTRIYNLWLIPLWNTRARLIDTGLWWFSVARREWRAIDSFWVKAGFYWGRSLSRICSQSRKRAFDLVKVEILRHKRNYKLIGKIRTFPFLPILFTAPSLMI